MLPTFANVFSWGVVNKRTKGYADDRGLEREAGSVNLESSSEGLRRVVLLVMALNLGYFGVEFAVALAIGSVSLFADSIDFLEDA